MPVLYEGIYNEELIKGLDLDKEKQEGYVVRIRDSFKYSDFNKCAAKFVRENHVQTDKHWMENCSVNSVFVPPSSKG